MENKTIRYFFFAYTYKSSRSAAKFGNIFISYESESMPAKNMIEAAIRQKNEDVKEKDVITIINFTEMSNGDYVDFITPWPSKEENTEE